MKKYLEFLTIMTLVLAVAGPVSAAENVAAVDTATAVAAAAPGSSSRAESDQRDTVGDLNHAAIQAGTFPGAFMIPGSRGVSLAIGGSIKNVAIFDFDAEAMGADFTPASLGTRYADEDGASSIDATLTKLFLDGRAPAGDGQLRGYIEWDMNNANDGNLAVKMRHAYGSWRNSHGTLVAGHTWSTMMDLKILPEGLTEPTVSGPIFVRQSIIRWSQPLSSALTLHAALEDPNGSDFDVSGTSAGGRTRFPDGILGFECDNRKVGHLRLNGILRALEVKFPDGDNVEALGWGLALSGHLNLLERDRWVVSGVFGEGLGRYLLGIQSTAGSVVDPNNDLVQRDNWGMMTAYQHHWSESLRSSAMAGHAEARPHGWQGGVTFESSSYAAANLMWQLLPYLTMGVEYAYGQRENKDGSDIDNHRVALGVQFY